MTTSDDQDRGPMSGRSEIELDNPVWWALAGSQQHLGRSARLAGRFDPEISPFGAMAGVPTDSAWADLAAVTGPGGLVVLARPEEEDLPIPPGWAVEWHGHGIQMVGHRVATTSAPSPRSGSEHPDPAERVLEPLGPEDAADMLALVTETRPGPFLQRTVEFGGYLGVRSGGRLIAMAGERLRLPGHTEISAVATEPAHRRQGLAELLVRAVAAGIAGRGNTPFLHVSATNTGAVRLYEAMGFVERRRMDFRLLRAPGTRPHDPPQG